MDVQQTGHNCHPCVVCNTGTAPSMCPFCNFPSKPTRAKRSGWTHKGPYSMLPHEAAENAGLKQIPPPWGAEHLHYSPVTYEEYLNPQFGKSGFLPRHICASHCSRNHTRLQWHLQRPKRQALKTPCKLKAGFSTGQQKCSPPVCTAKVGTSTNKMAADTCRHIQAHLFLCMNKTPKSFMGPHGRRVLNV